ncbi:hypothetical protein [Pandoraea oxalativorans]|uniref:Uncharacterized protein n=1 Tax=Pandoraea oxalativorans TaxID=573737 RepID=A0A0E3YA64_9BURK|nr:hypothetical protein [Pandoraea oxalativorans]AKC68641.2 hypothetical protein MB84_02950 [Pandoraea oxalativorans]
MNISHIATQVLAAASATPWFANFRDRPGQTFERARNITSDSPCPHVTREVPKPVLPPIGLEPQSYHHFLKTRLADLVDVCVVGHHDDRKNCLLDLPPGEPSMVPVSRLVESGCSRSLPPAIACELASTQREAWQLARAYRKQYSRDLRGKYSIASLEARIRTALHAMPDDVQQAFRHSETSIVVPRHSFRRFYSGVDEARRNGVKPNAPDATSLVMDGRSFLRDAMLGAYVVPPKDHPVQPFIVSLAGFYLIDDIRPSGPPANNGYEEWLAESGPYPDSQVEFRALHEHFFRHSGQTFGRRPNYLSESPEATTFRSIPRKGTIEQTLARYLHNGVKRYYRFAAAGPRERVARDSHRNARQALCDAGTFDGLNPRQRAQVFERLHRWMDKEQNA